jgi:acetylornithine deacetylase/succinyl-diaminopimelate desuccinylase-like protein
MTSFNTFSRRDILSLSAAGIWATSLAPQASVARERISTSADPDGTLARHIAAASAALDQQGLVELAVDLTNVPSPTGHEEEAARFLNDRMQAEGLTTRLQPVAPGRYNALGIYERAGRGKTLLLIGHLDTYVPRGDETMRSIPNATVVGGKRIYGNGILNMKGSLAAYVAAVRAVKRAGIDLAGNVLIAGVSGSFQNSPVDDFQGADYRGYGVGTKHLIANGGVADLCVLGEPTNFELVTQSFGVTCLRIDVDTSIDPFAGLDVHRNAATVAARVAELLDPWLSDYRSRNTVDRIAPQVGVIALESGRPWTTDAVPPPRKATVFVEIRTPPNVLPIAVLHALEPALANIRRQYSAVGIRAEPYSSNPGTSLPLDSPIIAITSAAHANLFGTKPKIATVGWHSDASHLNRYGIPTVNYGPAFRGTSLQDGEYLEIEDLVNCARVYIDIITRVCANPGDQS